MPTKAVAASGSVLVGGALTTVILSLLGHPVTPEVAEASQTLITAALAFLGAFLTRMEGTS